MATRATSRVFARRLLFSAVFAAFGAHGAVDMVPAVSVGFVRTDNIGISRTAPQAETVYQLIPALDITQESERVSSSVAYRLENYFYRGRDDSEHYNVFIGQTTFELDPDNFFLDLGASRGPTVRDPDQPIAPGNLYLNPNRTDRIVYLLQPSFHYPAGRNVTFDGSYRRQWVRFDEDETDPLLDDYQQETYASFGVNNFRRGRGLAWAIGYDSEKVEIGRALPWEIRRATVQLGGWVTESLRMFGSGGKESPWDRPFDPGLEDEFWEVGLTYNLRDRFSAEFARGERSFGDSLRGTLTYAFTRAQTSLTYVERGALQGRNPFGRRVFELPEGPDDLLTTPGMAERFVQERLEWDITFQLRRTDLTVRVFDEDRLDRVDVDGQPLGDEQQAGLGFDLRLLAGRRTTFIVGGDLLERDTERDIAADRTYMTLEIGVEYELGPRTLVRAGYVHLSDEADDQPEFGYRANTISAMLTRTFGR